MVGAFCLPSMRERPFWRLVYLHEGTAGCGAMRKDDIRSVTVQNVSFAKSCLSGGMSVLSSALAVTARVLPELDILLTHYTSDESNAHVGRPSGVESS